MTYALKPLTLGELLDRTFSFYRTNFVLFVGIAALPNLLMLTLQLLIMGGRSAGPLFVGLSSTVLVVSYLLAATLTQGATVIAVSNIQLGRTSTILDAFKSIWSRIGELMLVGLNVGVRVMLWSLLLIVPGVLAALRYSLAINVAVLEHTTISDSLTRSAELTKGHLGRIFAIGCLLIVLISVVSFVLQFGLAMLFGSVRGGHPSGMATLALDFGGFITQSLVGPIMTIAFALVYYDERVRKEAFDIAHMMAQLDSVTLAPSPGTA